MHWFIIFGLLIWVCVLNDKLKKMENDFNELLREIRG